MIERLIFNGVDHFFVAPGSRSSPLVSAIAHLDGAKIYSHIDERSLAFMALGYAQCTGMPGVMVVTSGTAVANLMPAVVEAKASLVPMIILSADRPYELRDTGANQTIDQAHLFSGHTIKSYDLAPPSTNVSIKKSQAIFDQALGYAVGVNPGPVQINIQLREPLHNISDAKTWYESSGLEHKFIQAKFYNPTASSLNSLFGAKNILFVVGEMRQALVQEKIIKLAEQLACPIFADITSNLRLKSHPLIMHHFDLALLNPQFMEELRPDVVIHFGDRVVSKRYWNFVEKSHAVRFIRLHENNI
ncbi:MAG: 2-succinyl-5-enolpyruvyl-6-hydroxy-3-cyclohexene-1-carboxylic-acid synthase, partial [Myxococcales bacterium]|nr:2-succinyl-5-enolpyruvyl-6-hydroxy-3-cyclohexene-1-carboxylic-acid synthase [Myxococcales bacterium]